MNEAVVNDQQSSDGASVSLVKVLLEGRAFFALIAIIVIFSLLSDNYFSLGTVSYTHLTLPTILLV